MKKTLFTFLLLGGITTMLYSQKEEKFEKLYYKDIKVENDDVTITVDNAVSTAGETKFKLKITNKTADYIIYKPQESKFIIDGKENIVVEKIKIIDPNDFGTVVINLKGTGYNNVKNYSFLLEGLYRVPANTKGNVTDDFKLPASKNDFTSGNYNCSMTKLTKETDVTEVKFKCSYNGNKIGIIFPGKAALKMPDGNEYANSKKKTSPIILMKGESDSFTLKWERMEGGKTMDMQKVEMFIKWNDAFAEIEPQKMSSHTLNIEFDEATTKAKK